MFEASLNHLGLFGVLTLQWGGGKLKGQTRVPPEPAGPSSRQMLKSKNTQMIRLIGGPIGAQVWCSRSGSDHHDCEGN